MKPVKFNEVNVTYAEGQKEHLPLPAYRTKDGEVITCWEFTDEELEKINRTKRLYLKQLTFNQPLQPILPLSHNPIITFTPHKQGENNNYQTVIASLINENPQNVIAIHDFYHLNNWNKILEEWLNKKEYTHGNLTGHLTNDEIYIVIGESPRNIIHACLYVNGELLHDPHTSNAGLKNELEFVYIRRR